MSEEVLGRGLSFPLRLSATGGLRESAHVQKVEQSIRIILGTQHGERLMRPTFGCNLRSLVFAPNNEITANLARYYVGEGLREWEPRIEVLEVVVTNDGALGALMIELRYRLRLDQSVQSMVYPFYLEGG